MIYSDDKWFDAWRTRAINAMPSVATRVFALRNKGYCGYGFHYSLEKLLGTCIRDLSDLENPEYYYAEPRNVIAHRIVLRLLVRELFARVAEAERDLNNDQSNR